MCISQPVSQLSRTVTNTWANQFTKRIKLLCFNFGPCLVSPVVFACLSKAAHLSGKQGRANLPISYPGRERAKQEGLRVPALCKGIAQMIWRPLTMTHLQPLPPNRTSGSKSLPHSLWATIKSTGVQTGNKSNYILSLCPPQPLYMPNTQISQLKEREVAFSINYPKTLKAGSVCGLRKIL